MMPQVIQLSSFLISDIILLCIQMLYFKTVYPTRATASVSLRPLIPRGEGYTAPIQLSIIWASCNRPQCLNTLWRNLAAERNSS